MKFYQDKKSLKTELYYRVILAVLVVGIWITASIPFIKNGAIGTSFGAFIFVFVNATCAVTVYLLYRAYVSHRESILHSCVEIDGGFVRMYERDRLVGEQQILDMQKLVVYSKRGTVDLMLLYFNKHVPFVMYRQMQPDIALERLLRSVGPNCKVIKKRKIF